MNEKANNCTEREQKIVNWSGSHPKGPGPSLLPLCSVPCSRWKVTPMSPCQQPEGRTKESYRESQTRGATQKTMNSKIDREKINARKLLKLLKDKIYGQVHFSWLALQSTTVANWISCQNKLRIEPSLSLLLKLSREKVLEDKN